MRVVFPALIGAFIAILACAALQPVPSSDRRQVERVCPGGVLLARDPNGRLEVIRPDRLAGWDVPANLKPADVCPALESAQ